MKCPQLQEMMDEVMELQMAPLIDCVFLLLIYFMVATTLHKSEADLGITLPGTVAQAQPMQMPDEQIVEIDRLGKVILNGKVFSENADERELPELVKTLVRYRLAAQAAGTKALITVQADGDCLHQRVVDVMNACAGAGITFVTFGME